MNPHNSSSFLRMRKTMSGGSIEECQKESEYIADLQDRNLELENMVKSLTATLNTSRTREKAIMKALEDMGGSVMLDLKPHDESDTIDLPFFDDSTFFDNFINRASWLIGLLIFQSASSFILSSNEQLIQRHPNIIYFLTMLVGAGGNAGNQAAVRVIREMAVGALRSTKRKRSFILREFYMAFSLSIIIGMFGFMRASLFSESITLPESIAICIALTIIVLISVIVGSMLPIVYHYFNVDPAHSSTTIQVIMDISGVLLTCLVASIILHSDLGSYIQNTLHITNA